MVLRALGFYNERIFTTPVARFEPRFHCFSKAAWRGPGRQLPATGWMKRAERFFQGHPKKIAQRESERVTPCVWKLFCSMDGWVHVFSLDDFRGHCRCRYSAYDLPSETKSSKPRSQDPNATRCVCRDQTPDRSQRSQEATRGSWYRYLEQEHYERGSWPYY